MKSVAKELLKKEEWCAINVKLSTQAIIEVRTLNILPKPLCFIHDFIYKEKNKWY